MAEQLHFETVNQLRQGYIARYERVQQAIHATRSATFEVTSNQLQQGQSAALSRVHMYMQQYAKVAAANPLHPESSAAIDALMHNHVIDGILSCADNTDPRIPDRAQEPAEAPAAEISVTEHLAHNMSKWVIENQKLRDENHQLRDKNQELENEVIELRFKLGVRERHRGHEPRYLGAEETIMGYMQAGFESLISTQTAVHKSEEEELQPKEPARPDEHSVEEFETGDLIGEAEDIHGTS